MPEPFRTLQFVVAGVILQCAISWAIHRVQVQRLVLLAVAVVFTTAVAIADARAGHAWGALVTAWGSGWASFGLLSICHLMWWD